MPPKPNLIFEIVGAWFRKPAPFILRNISLNTELTLYAEPTNKFDPNAIGVWIKYEAALSAMQKLNPNFDPDELTPISSADKLEVHIGYIPKLDAANLSFDRNRAILGEFKLSDTNKPQVKLIGFKKGN